MGVGQVWGWAGTDWVDWVAGEAEGEEGSEWGESREDAGGEGGIGVSKGERDCNAWGKGQEHGFIDRIGEWAAAVRDGEDV